VTTPAPSAQDALTQRVRDVLGAGHAVREVRMFGGVSFMVDGQLAVAAGRDGDLLVRVDPARYEELLRLGAGPASMGADRPMGNRWMTVPRSQLDEDERLRFWVAVGIESRSSRA
jgi:TfoX/Sxy family transcriptional regulator of competence genes